MSRINETSIFYLNTSPLKEKNFFDRYFNGLSSKMQNKIKEYGKEDDRQLSLGARVLMQKVFATHGVDINTAEFYRNDKWKPFLKSGEFEFNISHSGNYATLAISQYPVGIDIELIKEHGTKIAEKFFHKEEAEYLNTFLPKEEPKEENKGTSRESEDTTISDHAGTTYKEEFIKIWTQKEAYVKALGEGVKMGMGSFNVLDPNNLNGYNIKSLKLNENYIISISYKGTLDPKPYEIVL